MVLEDNQGNPIDEYGNLIIQKIRSIDEIVDDEFRFGKRNVELPPISRNLDKAIGANNRPLIIKKNIFIKNTKSHPELSPESSRNILKQALYTPNMHGATQPITHPDYKVAIHTGELNSVVVIDLYQIREHIEVVGWRQIDQEGLEKMKRQATREDGQLLILSPVDGSAADLSALPSNMPF